jgi:metaxin
VEVQVVPSTNHASPSGALPYLLPATYSSTASAVRTTQAAVQPIPSAKLYRYALDHATKSLHEPSASSPASLKQAAYQSLLDGPIRHAWLHALYLNRRNSPLLTELYLAPASSTAAVRLALHHQLRHAAESEILRSSRTSTSRLRLVGGTGSEEREAIYVAARSAFAALETLLEQSQTPWFFDAPGPTLFDASVFAYTQLLLDRRLGWVDRTVPDIVEAKLAVCRHRNALLMSLWSSDGEEAAVDTDTGYGKLKRAATDDSWDQGSGEGRTELGGLAPLEESSYVEVER